MEFEFEENKRSNDVLDQELENNLISEIVALQREFYFENRNKDSERRRRLREIIERATPLRGE